MAFLICIFRVLHNTLSFTQSIKCRLWYLMYNLLYFLGTLIAFKVTPNIGNVYETNKLSTNLVFLCLYLSCMSVCLSPFSVVSLLLTLCPYLLWNNIIDDSLDTQSKENNAETKLGEDVKELNAGGTTRRFDDG